MNESVYKRELGAGEKIRKRGFQSMMKVGAAAEPRFTEKALVPMCTEVRVGVTWNADEMLKIAMSPGIPP